MSAGVVAWLLISWLALSMVVITARALFDIPREYDCWDVVFGSVEVGLAIWAVTYLAWSV